MSPEWPDLVNTTFAEEAKPSLLPSTIPPFHLTKAANRASTEAYGMKDGKTSGRIFGTLNIDWTRSADSSPWLN